MAGPWERYQTQTQEPAQSKPWERYAATAAPQDNAVDQYIKSRPAGVGGDFIRGVATGGMNVGLGAAELGANALQAAGVDVSDFKKKLAQSEQKVAGWDKGTGIVGTVGEIAANPLTYIGGPAIVQGAKGIAKLAGIGAGMGAIAPTQDANSNIGTNAINAGKYGAISAAIPFGLSGAGKVIGAVSKPLVGAADRVLASAGSDAAANRVAARIISGRLADDAITPQAAQAAIQAAQKTNLGQTLGEILQSPAVNRYENLIMRGEGEGARIMRDAIEKRNISDIPRIVGSTGIAPLEKIGATASPLYEAAAQEAVGKRISDNLAAQMFKKVDDRLAELGDTKTLERTVLQNARGVIENAINKRGGTFEALNDAKKQLSDMFIENADATAQKQANRYTTPLQKGIDSVLQQISPQNYAKAKSASQAGMAARDLKDALAEAKTGSISQFVRKIANSPADEAEFLRKVPPAMRQQYRDMFVELRKVAKGFGGSDTAFNISGGQNLQKDITGFSTDILNPVKMLPTIAEKYIGGLYSPAIKKALAQQLLNPTAVTSAAKPAAQTSTPSALARAITLNAAQNGK